MLLDKVNKRVLMCDGTSVVSTHMMASLILKGDESYKNFRVLCCDDSAKFEVLFGEDVAVPLDHDPVLTPPNHEATPEAADALLDKILTSSRFDGSSEMVERVKIELSFFEKTDNIGFLIAVSELVERFKLDGVVWGVGRGSACASLVLYLLFVHDINPIRYEISFSELSKEMHGD